MARQRGNVKWFDTEKGWGFIRLEDGEEVFVHHSDIQSEGFRSLKDGAEVELEIERAERGPRARNVVPIGADGTPVSQAGGRSAGDRSAADRTGSKSGGERKGRGERERGGRKPNASRGGRLSEASNGATRSKREGAASPAGRAGAGDGLQTLDEQVRTRLAPRFRFDD